MAEPFSPFCLEEMKVLSFSRTVDQLIMRVRKPKVEYKLASQERPKGENLDVLVYKQFQITWQGSIKTRDS